MADPVETASTEVDRVGRKVVEPGNENVLRSMGGPSRFMPSVSGRNEVYGEA